MSNKSTWLQWHVVVGSEQDGEVQINFILGFIAPIINELGSQIELFHFNRHWVLKKNEEAEWRSWEGFDQVQARFPDSISYVIFRIRVKNEDVATIKETVDSKLKDFKPEVFPVYGPKQGADVIVGLEDYGGEAVHPSQHEFFHAISQLVIQLMQKYRAGELKINGKPCKVEDVARQWAHMLLLQMGVIDREVVESVTRLPILAPRSDGAFIPVIIYDLAFFKREEKNA